MNFEIEAQPLSVNQVWRGRRFKTQKYKDYEEEVGWLLKDVRMKLKNPNKIEGDVKVTIIFHLSPRRYGISDVDNFCKPALDILVKNGFIEDDRYITELNVRKVKSKREKMKVIIEKV